MPKSFRYFVQRHPTERGKRISIPVPGSGVVIGGDDGTGEEEEETASTPPVIGGGNDNPPPIEGIPGEVILLSSIAGE